MTAVRVAATVALGACTLFAGESQARADTLIIKQPGAHAPYVMELEPHLLIGGLTAPVGDPVSEGFGLGGRATFEILDPGFVPTINDSIGIGVGLDAVQFSYTYGCVKYSNGANGKPVCVSGDVTNTYFWIPVVMQWNFWLSRNWSVFGEPGVALRYMSNEDFHGHHLRLDPFVLYAGGRFHFSDTVTLTMRIGHPTWSVGVSFLL